jgi:hypothetical protein
MSTVKVNTVDKRTGGTLTLGGCGTTVTLGAGATQSGFGRTGTVDWCTTAKTAPFTGVSGNGYFVNTTCGAVTVTLPATPSAGDIISIADYASTFQTNNLTICRNSSKINGVCGNASLSTEGQSITLVYVDGTRGWKNTMDSTSDVSGTPNFIVATGGTISCCGDYKIHTFTSDSTFTICSAPTPANNNVDYLVVAGGGAGGAHGDHGAGAGAGGYRESHTAPVSGCYTASPLAAASSLPVSIQSYPITVGAGGAALPTPPSVVGPSGSPSSFSTITSSGGGGGAVGNVPGQINGGSGGSGGGGTTAGPSTIGNGGSGNTPPTSPPQGNNGGTGATDGATYRVGGGGGGAGAVGGSSPSNTNNSVGGDGVTTSISSSPTSYGGGGGSGATYLPGAAGGLGGGGAGGVAPSTAGTSGTVNTGGGGGGSAGCVGVAGSGGSGIVIIRYKFQ